MLTKKPESNWSPKAIVSSHILEVVMILFINIAFPYLNNPNNYSSLDNYSKSVKTLKLNVYDTALFVYFLIFFGFQFLGGLLYKYNYNRLLKAYPKRPVSVPLFNVLGTAWFLINLIVIATVIVDPITYPITDQLGTSFITATLFIILIKSIDLLEAFRSYKEDFFCCFGTFKLPNFSLHGFRKSIC